MKIIKPLRRSQPGESLHTSAISEDEQGDYRREVKVDPSVEEDTLDSKHLKPRSEKQRGQISAKRSKFSSDYKASLDNTVSDEQFDFDTSNLEAMPKDEVFEGPSKGRKRRRSDLPAEKASEPLSLVVDPEKKEFNDVFARGLRLLAMREHSVKELTTKLLARFDGSQKSDGSNATEDADITEEFDNTEGPDRSQGFDVIYAVIDDLLEKKYLSDERFTEVYIRSRCIRGFGPIKIKAELKSRGVSNHLIQDYLDPSAAIWFDNAKIEYQKKYVETSIKDYKAWAKRARFLQSRGFNMEQIHCAITPPEDN